MVVLAHNTTLANIPDKGNHSEKARGGVGKFTFGAESIYSSHLKFK
jgi:hypothetical protein